MVTGLIDRGVGRRDIPAPVRALSSLSPPDYADLFTLATQVEATPERWARAMFGQVPSPGELFIWRGLLGLRLTRERSPATVAGWQITGRGPDWIRLEAASWFLTGNLLVQTADGQVSLGTSCATTGRWAACGGLRCRPSTAGWSRGSSARPLPAWPRAPASRRGGDRIAVGGRSGHLLSGAGGGVNPTLHAGVTVVVAPACDD